MTDSQWREFNIYDNPAAKNANGAGQNEDDDEVIYASGMNLFGNMQEEEEEEIMNFSFNVASPNEDGAHESAKSSSNNNNKKKTVKVTLKGFSDYTQSTGMAVWLGSEILATYMAQHPYLIQGNTIMEMGSGLGLAGIVSHHLDSRKSVLTDGDSLVLNGYLSFNVKQNDRRLNGSDDDTLGTMECHQLIWGHQGHSPDESSKDGKVKSPLIQFRKRHGAFDVILAADCTYMPQSVEPFWETIDFLLKRDIDDESNDAITPAKSPSTPKVLYVMEASTQARFEDILDSAKRRGFEWTIDTMPSLEETPQYEGKEHEIYTFWRSS